MWSIYGYRWCFSLLSFIEGPTQQNKVEMPHGQCCVCTLEPESWGGQIFMFNYFILSPWSAFYSSDRVWHLTRLLLLTAQDIHANYTVSENINMFSAFYFVTLLFSTKNDEKSSKLWKLFSDNVIQSFFGPFKSSNQARNPEPNSTLI